MTLEPQKTIGRWTLLSKVEDGKHSKWLCVCTCGVKREVRQDKLNSGRSRSCGCLRNESHFSVMRSAFGQSAQTITPWVKGVKP